MTEQEWLSAKHPNSMVDHRVCNDRRKLRLLAVACARRMLVALPPEPVFGAIVDTAERYADDPTAYPDPQTTNLQLTVPSLGGNAMMATAYNVLNDLMADALERHKVDPDYAVFVMSNPQAVARTTAKAERLVQACLLRDIFGNPFRPVAFDTDWRTSTALALAKQMYDSRDFSAMPILADALQDAGCENEDVLNHCRDAKGVHVRGCWVVDLVLGKS